MAYYDGTKLLSMKDINGNTPEIYICTTNRSAGKTTYFSRYLVNRYIKYKEKFMLLYRYSYELTECANKFFKDIQGLFFPTRAMSGKMINKSFAQLYFDDCECGYAVALNLAENVKKQSHYFSDVKRIMFDEFQSETNAYCPNEISKFQSIHTSVARGQGEQVRYVPVYLVGNPVSILNPYYIALGITKRLRSDTKFLRGDGFVLEQGYNESASTAQKQSLFNRAFSSDNYQAYNAESIYLNDNTAFVEKMNGKSTYLCTLRYNGNNYGVRLFSNQGIVYVDDRADESFPRKIAVTTEDHNVNSVILARSSFFLMLLRKYFEQGAVRFKNLPCKECLLTAISYM